MPLNDQRIPGVVAFNDLDIMPFGKFKGRPMQEVPASYLAWLKDNEIKTDAQVWNYIIDNWSFIKDELPDRVG